MSRYPCLFRIAGRSRSIANRKKRLCGGENGGSPVPDVRPTKEEFSGFAESIVNLERGFPAEARTRPSRNRGRRKTPTIDYRQVFGQAAESRMNPKSHGGTDESSGNKTPEDAGGGRLAPCQRIDLPHRRRFICGFSSSLQRPPAACRMPACFRV